MSDKPILAPCEKHRPGPAARQAARLGGKIPSLDTRRLQIRAPRIYDFKAYAKIMESDRSILMGGPFSRKEAWAEFTSYSALWMLHGHGLWTIDAQTTPSAGFILLGYEYDDPEPELGIFLSDDAEGQGIAEEAMIAVRDYAFEALKWDSVASFVDQDNDRCIKLMERLNATRDTEAEATISDDGHTLVYRHSAKGAA
ncbi:GNAT family N-acetyltransferase [uncultured Pelagimonas sp.]|uniref:GNAT family N-acetyltransferase n=1 Tax=uncultured Pelagimonas sp. TaxID=1618102 RepID=UPI002602456A|nr:GNAT family N-acetyltransferase [uncultured Pelagimonas sp.]